MASYRRVKANATSTAFAQDESGRESTKPAVYIPLKAYTGHVAAEGRVAGRQWHRMEAASPDAVEAISFSRQAEPELVEAALKTDPAVVVLGDPGSGKSTLLKVSNSHFVLLGDLSGVYRCVRSLRS